MSQIYDRISRFIKTELNFSSSKSKQRNYNDEEDLKKIIEELDREAKKQRSHHSSGSERSTNNSGNTHNTELQNAFNLFGINSNSSKDEIKSAYKKKMMQYHPDRVSHLGTEYVEAAKIKTVEYNQAYQVLKKFGKV